MEQFEIIESESKSMLEQAREMRVNSDEEYSAVGSFILGCKQLIAKIKAEFSEPKRKADEAHKAITAMEKRSLEPVVGAMELAGGVALDYKKEQDRLAKEEADRITAENRRLEEDRRSKEAEELERKGDSKAAGEVLSAPMPTQRAFKPASFVPKVAGLSTKKTWKGRIVAPSKVKIQFCLPDQALVNAKVQSFFAYVKDPTPAQIKELEAEIGGVEVYEAEVFAGRVK